MEHFIRNQISNRKKAFVFFVASLLLFAILMGRLFYLCVICSGYYTKEAQELHERERAIKAARGIIYDCNGVVLATNQAVCTISVIHSQVEDKEAVIACLTKELSLSEEYVTRRVEKYTSIEKVKSNVPKEIGDRIRKYNLKGIKVDEDYKRYYPYDELASKVIGFTGGDNQGIIGLEVEYESYLKGTDGTILAMTDARGVELRLEGERRIEPIAGDDLYISIDRNIQQYATQLALQDMETKEADGVSIIVMNPVNGEILAMVDVPEFNLNEPFTLTDSQISSEIIQDELNKMWRNGCINDTYEPGSTFKIITAAAALEEGVVTVNDSFYCPGYVVVEDRRIRCHKTTGHGSEDFVTATMNSCNPVFITVGLRLGAKVFYNYFEKFGLFEKTGIDLPGEAGTIMHKLENIGMVELATVAFGQSFQVTPIQLLSTAAMIVNGGTRITPHLGVKAVDSITGEVTTFQYQTTENVLSRETSETMQYILEKVVSEGTGKNGAVEVYSIGGKTATSQTLPRGSGRYIASYIGFTPADNPELIAIAIVENPKGVYYGGQVAAPIIRQLFENILPYLDRKDYN